MHSNNDTQARTSRPQNKSCPAGGTNQARKSKSRQVKRSALVGQRGVIVAPPSRNTSPPAQEEYTVLHRGFDTLALSIKQTIPIKLFDYLTQEKELAEEERRDVLIKYNNLQFLLKPNGGSGYRFILSDGNASATWAFKRPNAKDPWGIRISIGSLFLATSGLGAARAYIEMVLERLGIRTVETDISISRIDYCVDILAPNFTLHPDNVVMHSSTGRRDYITGEDLASHGKSGRVTSVTCGSVRNRQAILYDKRAEIIASAKSYWWDIWSTYVYRENPTSPALYSLHNVEARADPTKSRVWRVEMRAGKDLLKDRWNIRTWADLFERYGDLIHEACEVIRYTQPDGDSNRARWPNHPLWEIAAAEMNADLFEMHSGVDPNPLKEIQRAEKLGQLTQSFVGIAISMAALQGRTFEELPDYFKKLGNVIDDTVQAASERYAKQLAHANDRYVFIRKATKDED